MTCEWVEVCSEVVGKHRACIRVAVCSRTMAACDMSPTPHNQKIYHITHYRNLPGIVRDGVLWSDAKRSELALNCEVVGMSEIKRRRLEEIEVDCNAGTMVGEYVPFYFCPRSVMLYILHMGNHPDLTYRQGQRPIVHLQADLAATLAWAQESNVRWAFSDRNAGAYLANFSTRERELGNLDWVAVAGSDFRDPVVKEAKQAEFLVFESFPWNLIEEIGTIDAATTEMVIESINTAVHQPRVRTRPAWYY